MSSLPSLVSIATLTSFFSLSTLLLTLLTPTLISAHGRITTITVGTKNYTGWDPEFALSPPAPKLAAWSAENLGNIYVTPSNLTTPNIACHMRAVPGALEIPITAGETLRVHWNEWPTSHVGPVLSYLAPCGEEPGSCTRTSAATLAWTKVDEMGWLSADDPAGMGLGGTWATDVFIKDRFRWDITVPARLRPGGYVLRHEIIALHVADVKDGAQFYPQCVNLRVAARDAGSSVELKGGVVGSRLYRVDDPGVLIDVHHGVSGYMIPGPKVWRP
ncbi:lytic polysaccharide monooxygenase [Patellaria atrata CBS 101060]|uniref:Lytic polysaccharide monooxygenase n=1 Tax=Patellaria atrata CBS 101060 TaxID=1346257 RepID=A0A9P4SAI8_9PEZI|nr:lytic polysaccharide monooxygenase [Patellaria atrata CBS 101060]